MRWRPGFAGAVALAMGAGVPATGLGRAELTPGATGSPPPDAHGRTSATPAPSVVSTGRHFALRGRLLFPYGVLSAPATAGVEAGLRPAPWVETQLAVDANGLVFGSEAQVALLFTPLFGGRSGIGPYLGGSLQYLRFLPAADRAVGAAYPGWSGLAEALGRDELRLEGTQLILAKVELGIDWVTRGGFNLQVGASRSMQLGDSFGRSTEDGVLLRGWQSWGLEASAGVLF